MKTSQQIIGLPVVSILDGNEIGRVKNVMINAVKGTVDFFVIDSAIRSLAGGVVPVGKVLGIGADALTILEADDVSDIVKIPAAIDLLQKNITVRGTRVLTRKGSLLGVAGDVHIDEESACGIIGVEFLPSSAALEAGIIPRESIITFGKNLLVVEEGFTSRLLSMPRSKESDSEENASVQLDEATAVEAPAFLDTETKESVAANSAEKPSQAEFEPEISLDGLFSTAQVEQEASEVMTDRRLQYLRGRRVTRGINSAEGETIAREGDIIDDKLMERASKAGCIIELVMNNEA